MNKKPLKEVWLGYKMTFLENITWISVSFKSIEYNKSYLSIKVKVIKVESADPKPMVFM